MSNNIVNTQCDECVELNKTRRRYPSIRCPACVHKPFYQRPFRVEYRKDLGGTRQYVVYDDRGIVVTQGSRMECERVLGFK